MNLRLQQIALYCLTIAAVWAQPGQPVTLIIDVDDFVEYIVDIEDPNKYGRQTGIVPTSFPLGVPRVGMVGDIVAVNGQPAKGTFLVAGSAFGARPNLTPGFAIADITRTVFANFHIEILQADGTPIGTIEATGGKEGSPPPGSPSNQSTTNYAIVGGTGAFFGARGAMGRSPWPGSRAARTASIAEDTAYRRINRGGQHRYILVFYPMFTPRIAEVNGLPAVSHAAGFAPVTAASPAAPGETLSLFVTGLGPTTPSLDPGTTFPAAPLAAATSPVSITVGGAPCVVTAAVGYPGSDNGFQVNFTLPANLPSGPAELKLSVAWSNAPSVRIPIR